jgi:hypothetical protein
MKQTRLFDQHEDLPLFTIPETPAPPPAFEVGKRYLFEDAPGHFVPLTYAGQRVAQEYSDHRTLYMFDLDKPGSQYHLPIACLDTVREA